MAHVMTRRGSEDNVITYVHYCDTAGDMDNIPTNQITLGSICVVLEGTSGSLELYIANSSKEWILL